MRSETHGNQDDSDVVGAAAPHRLAGQLLAGGFVPELLLGKLHLHLTSLLHNGGLLQSTNVMSAAEVTLS